MSVCVRAFLHVCVGVWVNNNLSLVPNTCMSATCECGCQGWCVYVLRETNHFSITIPHQLFLASPTSPSPNLFVSILFVLFLVLSCFKSACSVLLSACDGHVSSEPWSIFHTLLCCCIYRLQKERIHLFFYGITAASLFMMRYL